MAGAVPLRLPWRKFVKTVAEEPVYAAVCSNVSGSRPKELYQDLQEELEAEAATDCAAVKAAVKAAGRGLHSSTSQLNLSRF